MKKLFILVYMLMLLAFMACARSTPPPDFAQTTKTEAYSYQGPVNPTDLAAWERIAAVPITSAAGVAYDMYLKNPDSDATIQYVNAIVIDRGLLGYYLIYQGHFYGYQYAPASGGYEAVKIEAETLQLLKDDFKEHFGVECN